MEKKRRATQLEEATKFSRRVLELSESCRAGRFGARIFEPDSERRAIAQRISAQISPACIITHIFVQQGGRRALSRVFRCSNRVSVHCRMQIGATKCYRTLPRAFPRRTYSGCVNQRKSPNRERI
eukprot:Gb_28322 [translate_table: standard]